MKRILRDKTHLHELSGLMLILLLLVVFLVFAYISDRITRRITEEQNKVLKVEYEWRLLNDTLMLRSTENPVASSEYYSGYIKTIDTRIADFLSNPLFEVLRKESQSSAVTYLKENWIALSDLVKESIAQDTVTHDLPSYETLAQEFNRSLDQISIMYESSYTNQLQAIRTLFFFLLATIFLYIGFSVQYVNSAVRRQQEIKRSKDFSQAVLEAQDNERRRLAGELHDGVCQDLAFVKLALQKIPGKTLTNKDLAKQCADTEQRVGNALTSVRRLSYELLPPQLDQGLLTSALNELCQNISNLNGIDMKFTAIGMKDAKIDSKRLLSIYRIAQEACSNICKHSEADSGNMKLALSWPVIILNVSDNGQGLPSGKTIDQLSEHSLGIRSMRERTRILGGNFTLKNGQDAGVAIRVEIPLTKTG